MDRRAQLPGAQLHARRHAGGRRRAVLPLVVPRARHRRVGRGLLRALPRPHPVRPQEPLLRRRLQAGSAALAAGRRALRTQEPPDPAGRAARARGAGRHGGAPARQPALDHAGFAGRMALYHRQADGLSAGAQDPALRGKAITITTTLQTRCRSTTCRCWSLPCLRWALSPASAPACSAWAAA
ncbi:hypothetical protein CBM2587_A200018 [Cupriavidus taiwanensis]|uniref:Uncharacterized protein n=1 Tax=Cupriavidus taiwanensis TaxID=164546 RepID=A0A375BR64_9BURK|nr:hypothetical protein CBM2587_A200018 [Cupriavidus taiwanensis]